MKHSAFASVIGVTALIMSSLVWAGNTILCPDISQVRQVGECPTEDDVERMFKISCGFERDSKAMKPELCDTYAEFKRRKYTALWESSDGEFMGYVKCAAPPAEIKMSKPSSVTVSQKNGLYKISCEYEGDIAFTLRTRGICRLPGVKSAKSIMRANCGPDASTCKVECD